MEDRSFRTGLLLYTDMPRGAMSAPIAFAAQVKNSVWRRPLDVFDHDREHRTTIRLERQAELFAQRHEQGRQIVHGAVGEVRVRSACRNRCGSRSVAVPRPEATGAAVTPARGTARQARAEAWDRAARLARQRSTHTDWHPNAQIPRVGDPAERASTSTTSTSRSSHATRGVRDDAVGADRGRRRHRVPARRADGQVPVRQIANTVENEPW